MTKGDKISGAFWLSVSLVTAFESYRLGVGQFHAPQAGFLPFVASLLLAVLSVSLLVTASHRKREAREPSEDITFNVYRVPKVLYALGSLFLYGMLLIPTH